MTVGQQLLEMEELIVGPRRAESSQFEELGLSRVQPVESHSRVRSGWLVRRRCSQFGRTGQLDALVVCVLFFSVWNRSTFPRSLVNQWGQWASGGQQWILSAAAHHTG